MEVYNLFQEFSRPPESGGYDDQTAEWVTAMRTCFQVRNEADRHKALEEAAESSDNEDETTEYED